MRERPERDGGSVDPFALAARAARTARNRPCHQWSFDDSADGDGDTSAIRVSPTGHRLVSELYQLAHKRAVPGIYQDSNPIKSRDGHVQITVAIDVRKSDAGTGHVGHNVVADVVCVVGCVVKRRAALRGPLEFGVVCCDLCECGNWARLIQVDLVTQDKHVESTLDLHHGGVMGASSSSAERAARVDPKRPIAAIPKKLVGRQLVGNQQVQIACVWKRRRNAGESEGGERQGASQGQPGDRRGGGGLITVAIEIAKGEGVGRRQP